MKTTDEIRKSIENKDYENQIPRPTSSKVKPDHVFDENQSVKWNREKAEEHNKAVAEEWAKYRKGEYKANFHDDCAGWIMDYAKFNKKQADIIIGKCWENYHSAGYDQVLSHIEDEVDYIENIIYAGVVK